MSNFFKDLKERFQGPGRVVIQTHDYPDFDAVAAAFGFSYLLKEMNPVIVAGGDVDSYSLQETMKQLKIPLIPLDEWVGQPEDKILLVDSNPNGLNVTMAPGRLSGVVDHHPVSMSVCDCFIDIRANYGSCSAMVYSYFTEVNLQPPSGVATALMMGIMMDTGFLTRGVSPEDLEAFNHLYFIGDWRLGSYLLKNSLTVAAIPRFQEALTHFRVDRGFGFSCLEGQAGAETIALIADDFMRFHEIHFVVVAAPFGTSWKISARSEDPLIPAGGVIQRALLDLGPGGGHIHMGGGSVTSQRFPGADELFRRFREAIDYFIRKGSV